MVSEGRAGGKTHRPKCPKVGGELKTFQVARAKGSEGPVEGEARARAGRVLPAEGTGSLQGCRAGCSALGLALQTQQWRTEGPRLLEICSQGQAQTLPKPTPCQAPCWTLWVRLTPSGVPRRAAAGGDPPDLPVKTSSPHATVDGEAERQGFPEAQTMGPA